MEWTALLPLLAIAGFIATSIWGIAKGLSENRARHALLRPLFELLLALYYAQKNLAVEQNDKNQINEAKTLIFRLISSDDSELSIRRLIQQLPIQEVKDSDKEDFQVFLGHLLTGT